MGKAPCGDLYSQLFELVVFGKYSELRKDDAIEEQVKGNIPLRFC
jgi:hypothetical protein